MGSTWGNFTLANVNARTSPANISASVANIRLDGAECSPIEANKMSNLEKKMRNVENILTNAVNASLGLTKIGLVSPNSAFDQ